MYDVLYHTAVFMRFFYLWVMDTKYISFHNQKGGTGKTTLCVILAGMLSRDNHRVLVIDTDPDPSLFDLEPPGMPLFKVIKYDLTKVKMFHEYLLEVEQDYDYILIDTPAGMGGLEKAYVIQISHLVIMPIVPADMDTKSTMKFLDAAELVISQYGIRVIGVINKADQTLEMQEIRKLQGYNGLILLDTELSYWVYYRRTRTDQVMATDQTEQFYTEIKKHLS